MAVPTHALVKGRKKRARFFEKHTERAMVHSDIPVVPSIVDVLRVRLFIRNSSAKLYIPPCYMEDKWPYPPESYVEKEIKKQIGDECVVKSHGEGSYTIETIPDPDPGSAHQRLVKWRESINAVPQVNLTGEPLLPLRVSKMGDEKKNGEKTGAYRGIYLENFLDACYGKTVLRIEEKTGAIFSRSDDGSTVIWGTKRQMLECEVALKTLVDLYIEAENVRPNLT